MPTHEELKVRAEATSNAAADWYDAPANSFWARFGRDTVTALQLRPGMRVLDVCSGSGASAIPAAEAVGPTGTVIAVDLAQDLLALLSDKARRLGLAHLEVRKGGLMALDHDGPGLDAVICVFGIFFVGDEISRLMKRAPCRAGLGSSPPDADARPRATLPSCPSSPTPTGRAFAARPRWPGRRFICSPTTSGRA